MPKKVFLNDTVNLQVSFTQSWVVFFLMRPVFKPTSSKGRLLGWKRDIHYLRLHPARDLSNENLAWQPSDMLRWNPPPVKHIEIGV